MFDNENPSMFDNEVVDCYTALAYFQKVLPINDTVTICESSLWEMIEEATKQTSQNIPRSFSANSDNKFKDACCCTCQKGLVIWIF